MTHEFEAFVYVWTNIKNGMFYIGKHLGSEDDGYISSGKYFLLAYNDSPRDFERTIVFRGKHSDVRREETRRIEEAIQTVGYSRIYNLTTYGRLRGWTRKCLHCGAVCCPENERWAEAFDKFHFSNCVKAPRPIVERVIKPVVEKVERPKKEKKIKPPKKEKKLPPPKIKKNKEIIEIKPKKEKIVRQHKTDKGGFIYSRWLKKYNWAEPTKYV